MAQIQGPAGDKLDPITGRETAERKLDPVLSFGLRLEELAKKKAAAGADARTLNEVGLGVKVLETARNSFQESTTAIRTQAVKEAARPDGDRTPGTGISNEVVARIYERIFEMGELHTQAALLKVGIESRCEMSLDPVTKLPKVDRYLAAGETTDKQAVALVELQSTIKSAEAASVKDSAALIRSYSQPKK